MTQPSPLYRLLEERLRRPLIDFVAERRATHTWSEIARAVTDETDVDVTSQSLRNWFKDRIQLEIEVKVS